MELDKINIKCEVDNNISFHIDRQSLESKSQKELDAPESAPTRSSGGLFKTQTGTKPKKVTNKDQQLPHSTNVALNRPTKEGNNTISNLKSLSLEPHNSSSFLGISDNGNLYHYYTY